MTNIVIGLGGMGGRVVRQVAETNKENNNTFYAVLDLDAHDNYSIMDSNGDISAFLLSKNVTINDYIEMYAYLGVKEWLPLSPFILRENLLNGSGQRRYSSRLCFLDFLKSGSIESLEELIGKAISPKNEDTIKVTVVSSLAGGTGSGIFIQLALWLRKRFFKYQWGNLINGIFILPDVFVDTIVDVRHNRQEIYQLYANTYAAIKELNAITKVKVNGTTLEQVNIDGLFDGVDDSASGDPVYDYVYFIDAINKNGVSFKSIDDYKAFIAQAIETQLFSPIRKRLNEVEKGLFLDVVRRNDKFTCGSIGVAKAVYPTEHVFKYCSLRLIQDILSQAWTEIDEELENLIIPNSCNDGKHDRNKARKEYVRLFEEKCKTFNKDFGAQSFIERVARDTKNETRTNHDEEVHILYTDKAEDFMATVQTLIEATVDKRCFEILSEITEHKNMVSADCNSMRHCSIVEELEQRVPHILDYLHCEAILSVRETIDIVFPIRYEEININNQQSIFSIFTKPGCDGKSGFIHPIAVRCLLYKLMANFEDIFKNSRQVEIARENAILGSNKHESIFDSKRTTTVETTPGEYLESKRFYQNTKKFLDDFKCRYEQYKNAQYELCREYAIAVAMKEISGHILKRLKDMAGIVEAYFENIPKLRTMLSEAICHNISQDSDSATVLHVFSSADEKESIYQSLKLDCHKEMIDFNESSMLALYKQFCDWDCDYEMGKACYRLLNEFILERAQKIKMEFGHIIDIDILSAVCRSAEYKNRDRILSEAERIVCHTEALKAIMTSLRHGSAPFLMHTSERVRTIELWGMSDEPYNTDLAFRTDIKVYHDSNSPKNELVCYRSVYGVFVSDTDALKEDGLMHRAYQEIVNAILASEGSMSLVHTPHLDKTWHLVLPEIITE